MRNLRLRWALAAVQLVFGLSVHALGAERFYRIIDGPHPGVEREQIDRFIYGSDVLYTGDAVNPPVKVDGIVWHANLTETRYYVGTRNPVTDQGALYRLIENDKWEEAKLMMKYAPDAFPKTENLAALLAELRLQPLEDQLPLIEQALRERYPDGFFLKPVAGFNAAGTFPTEKTEFAADYAAYLKDVKPRIEQRLRQTDPETVHLELKELPHYSGRVLEDLLTRPSSVIVQAKIPAAIGSIVRTPDGKSKALLAEYRVHVVEGKVLKEATQTRWEDARSVSTAEFERVEAFAQAVLDRLPAQMRKMCFGLDVMRTRTGGYQIIELNPGGESGYLYPDTDLWVTQLLAAHYQGGHTELLDEFERFSKASGLDAKEAALKHLLERPELRKLTAEIAPVTELLARAKDVLLADLKAKPSRETAMDALLSLKKFDLAPYLTAPEIEQLANLIRDPVTLRTAGVNLDALADSLDLAPGEILFVGSEGEIRLLNGLSYDDAAVEEQLLARLRGDLEQSPNLAEAERRARDLVDAEIATRAELADGSVLIEGLARQLFENANSQGRIFYSGTRDALVRRLVEGLIR